MESEQTYDIDVCGIACVIATEDKARLDSVIGMVEERMRQIMSQSPKVSVAAAALMTALEYCDISSREQEAAQNMREQIREYIMESQNARIRCEELMRENDRLRARLASLEGGGSE